MTPDDLATAGAVLSLFDRQVARGAIGASEHEQLFFMAAAVHARSLVAREGGDVVRLFAYVVNGRRSLLITQTEEDEAVAALKRELDVLRPAPREWNEE